MTEKIVICGAGGYVGSHLAKSLVERGNTDVVGIVRKPPSFLIPGVQYRVADLHRPEACQFAVKGAFWVFNFAASVGGIQYVTSGDAQGLRDSIINLNLTDACERAGVARYFFASSSCVYPDLDTPLKESDAYPANPVAGYGWEKLFSERVCAAYSAERNLPTTVIRYHGIYGPKDVRGLNRDHVIAALVRKTVRAKLDNFPEISIWGDGNQTRSFLFIDDCIEGTVRAMMRGVSGPINLAHPKPASVNDIVTELEDISAMKLTRFYQPNAPVGRVRKTADCSAMREALNWQPEMSLKDGLRRVYHELWTKEFFTPVYES